MLRSALRPLALTTGGPVRGGADPADARTRLHARDLALLLWCALPPLCINAAAILQPWVSPVELFRDPLLAAEQKFRYIASLGDGALERDYDFFWLGAVSNLGALAWAATAGALLVGLAIVLLRGKASPGRRAQLVTALALTVLLALDDVFQIHEQHDLIGPLKGEWVLYPLFAALLGSYALHVRRTLAEAPLLLGAAVACFAVSLLADQLLPQRSTTVLLEDTAELFGIFFWAGHHVVMALSAVVETMDGNGDGVAERIR